MIIDTNDGRQLEVVITLENRLFIAVKDAFGNEETIILDTEQAEALHSYLSQDYGAFE